MFRVNEDEFLRKADYSRNCLTFEEERQEASKIASTSFQVCAPPPPPGFAAKVVISCGGMCTEPFCPVISQQQNPLVGVCNNELVAFLCPSRNKKNVWEQVDFERSAASWLSMAAIHKPCEFLVFSTSHQLGDTISYRYLSSTPTTGKKQLETGRFVTSYSACFLELAMRIKNLHVTCFVVFREPVLSMETMEALLQGAVQFLTPEQCSQAKTSFKHWANEGLVEDEKFSRLFEPEGMFM